MSYRVSFAWCDINVHLKGAPLTARQSINQLYLLASSSRIFRASCLFTWPFSSSSRWCSFSRWTINKYTVHNTQYIDQANLEGRNPVHSPVWFKYLSLTFHTQQEGTIRWIPDPSQPCPDNVNCRYASFWRQRLVWSIVDTIELLCALPLYSTILAKPVQPYSFDSW